MGDGGNWSDVTREKQTLITLGSVPSGFPLTNLGSEKLLDLQVCDRDHLATVTPI